MKMCHNGTRQRYQKKKLHLSGANCNRPATLNRCQRLVNPTSDDIMTACFHELASDKPRERERHRERGKGREGARGKCGQIAVLSGAKKCRQCTPKLINTQSSHTTTVTIATTTTADNNNKKYIYEIRQTASGHFNARMH